MRDRFLDALRAGSLLVVVAWHWFGTTLDPETYSTRPSVSAPGLWLASWVLQVMPVFFFVGGSLHVRAYRPGFVSRRILGLLRSVAPLLAAWALIAGVLSALGGVGWARETVEFALSPLWFLAVYLMLVALLPVAVWLHRRLDLWALAVLGGAAVVVDVLRLGFGVPGVGWVNLVVVWMLAHQAGFHYERLVAARRSVGYALVAAGLLGLTVLVAVVGYPGWMVGVPTEKWSNMSPPTVAIVALIVLQTGLVALARPVATRVLATAVAGRVLERLNRYGMPLYLFHLSALLLAVVVGWPVALLALAVVVHASSRRRARAPVHRRRRASMVRTSRWDRRTYRSCNGSTPRGHHDRPSPSTMVCMKRVWLVAAVVMLAVSGCGTGAGDGDLFDDWAAMAQAKAKVWAEGCHDTSGYQAGVVRTEAIPCDRGHALETFYVGQLPENGLPAANSQAFWTVVDDCERRAATFLGGQWYDARLDLTVGLPTSLQWEGGGRWFHCTLAESSEAGDTFRRRSESLRGAAKAGAPLTLGCVSKVGSTSNDDWDYLRAAECTQPHDAEYAGSFKVPDLTYPKDPKGSGLYKQCFDVVARYIGGTRDGMQLGYMAELASPEKWTRGDRYVQCYAWTSKGPLTKSVKGLGNGKPT